MSEGSCSRGGYKPQQSIELPPLYAWPPRPVAAVRWLLFELLFPWGFVWIGLAFFSWHFLTPSEQTMAVLEPGWIFQIWVRNVCLLLLLAGGLHAWLYLRRAQKREYKYNTRWPSLGSRKFLWQDQVKDNMFWSLVSGCFFWTLFEALTQWYRASGNMVMPGWSFSEGYLVLMLYAVFFWSTFHFYLIHRLLHWPPLYKAAHELHHRNVNTGPWSGISMHPLEHLIYFTLFLLWWVIPVHPAIVILTGFFNGLSPAVSHSGFDRLILSESTNAVAGDHFHHLHHKHFEVNYGNTPAPLDKLFGSWHDGTPAGQALMKSRKRGIQNVD